jgi:hypothetical protein
MMATRRVFLAGRKAEDVEFWHDLDAGYAGRRRFDDTAADASPFRPADRVRLRCDDRSVPPAGDPLKPRAPMAISPADSSRQRTAEAARLVHEEQKRGDDHPEPPAISQRQSSTNPTSIRRWRPGRARRRPAAFVEAASQTTDKVLHEEAAPEEEKKARRLPCRSRVRRPSWAARLP